MSRTGRDEAKKFLVDGMLGSLARKLRILGFDTIYDKESSDPTLISKALSGKRVLVTSDILLHRQAMRQRVECILVKSRDDKGRLYEIFTKAGFYHSNIEGKPSRCSVCNGELIVTSTKTSDGRQVYACYTCGKTYWKGSHWYKLEKLFQELNLMLRKDQQTRFAE
jgi:uncharacterized protein with PIN domain